jgi:hypothetical protein
MHMHLFYFVVKKSQVSWGYTCAGEQRSSRDRITAQGKLALPIDDTIKLLKICL